MVEGGIVDCDGFVAFFFVVVGSYWYFQSVGFSIMVGTTERR